MERPDTSFTRINGSYEYNDLRDYSLKIDNELKLNQQNTLEFGLNSTIHEIEYNYSRNDTVSIINRDDNGLTTALYIQDKHTFSNKLILKGGFRATYFDVTGKTYLEPRTSFSYLLSDKLKIKGAWGIYHQFATRVVREDIQQGSRDFWVLANEDNIPVGFSEHLILGTSFETGTWLIDVEAYRKNLDGLSEYTTRFIPGGFGMNRTLNYEEYFYDGTGVAQGIEFLLQKKVGSLTGWVGYTLGEVKYSFDAFGDDPFYASQDQTHELKLVGNYKLKDWSFGLTYIYATGKPYTAPTGFYEIELLDGSTTGFFEVSDKNALRLPDYHRLDLSATYNFKFGTTNASAGLSLFNLYNKKNIWYKEYDVIEGELIETDISLLDFTPSLFFTWKLR